MSANPADDPLAGLASLRDTIARHELAARKSLGQHFLLDPGVLDPVAGAAGDLSAATVFEIGPGPGGLTRALVRAGARHVIAIERDRRCIAALQDLVARLPERLRVIEADALGVDLAALAPPPRLIVANLPYNIASALLVKWLAEARQFDAMILMFQKEVAERLVAAPRGPSYGRLSVIAQFHCTVTRLFDLPPGAFWPPPKVHSSVVRLKPRLEPPPADPAVLARVTAAAFGQRRKMLRSSLKSLGVDVAALLERTAIAPTARAEELSVAQFCTLANALADPAAKF